MMKNRQYLVFVVLMQISLGGFSQNTKNINQSFGLNSYTLSLNQIKYKQPANFNYIRRELGNEEYLKCIFADPGAIYQGYWHKIISKDKNFVAIIDIPPVWSKDSVHIFMELAPESKIKINTYHLSHIKADFGSNIGKGIDSLEGFPIKYKSSKYAHEVFNADTVITYPLKMWQRYGDQYNHCQVVVIQKNSRGFVCLYCFYNDKGERKLNRYLKSLEGMFWYRDPKDYIEVIEPPKSDSIIHIIPRKKKDLIQ